MSKDLDTRRAAADLQTGGVSGEFLTMAGERWYAIRNVDRMPPFFMSVISSDDHWLFVSSTGGLTAGRVSPETALFPYVPVDRIHESWPHTGCKTVVRLSADGSPVTWEPFNREQDHRFRVSRNLYKTALGNKLCFEEINHDLSLVFRYCWSLSDEFGFVRDAWLENHGDSASSVELLDGLQNVLPAGTPRHTQDSASNLVDAYKWTELDEDSGLAMFTLYSGISDRAEPSESLCANTIFCLGLESPKILLSVAQLGPFRRGEAVTTEQRRRGIRGAYLVGTAFELAPGAERRWQLVANVEQSQADVVGLLQKLEQPRQVQDDIDASVAANADELGRIMASSDAFQATAEENVSVHHYANTLFNVLRGGIVDDQYAVSAADFRRTVRHFNADVFSNNRAFLDGLPERIDYVELVAAVAANGDPQLLRLCREYLPITFGRRHGDPSRPWNRFAIRLRDDSGRRLLSYEGNWRDIFQNWEALTFSFPEFIENAIAKFVNASTVDGYNPYRITKQGIDWEVEEPDDPWSYIGYWGDHQIIYLLKLLELSCAFHPERLHELLHERSFAYANVPYRIRDFHALVANPKQTVDFDEALAERIDARVAQLGADGKLLLDDDDEVCLVNLLEKLLVPLLAKLGNLVVDGGIWLNTQRPEWNDANNALVGNGLSMVTLYYMRRYVQFLATILEQEDGEAELSREVADWLQQTVDALQSLRSELTGGELSSAQRFTALSRFGLAASQYRSRVYAKEGFTGRVQLPLDPIRQLLADALDVIDRSIRQNQRADKLYHAYNLLHLDDHAVGIEHLYTMLEGQVAALSAGHIEAQEAVGLLEALFASDLYREDQRSFMLYPDRDLPGFLAKNRIDAGAVRGIPLLADMLDKGDERIVLRDPAGEYRFHPSLKNAGVLRDRLAELADEYGARIGADQDAIAALYETTFNHKAFTGRSGGMFGFEGLGCIYWHMVSKLLLAVQENFFAACEASTDAMTCRRLGDFYYRIREGIGFNKTPAEYGAFPTDPYSHTPKHAGARQPGMTGQVKEEVLTRFGELGLRIKQGSVSFDPALLRAREFVDKESTLRYLDVAGQWQEVALPRRSLGFTWCQVPIVYRLDDDAAPAIQIAFRDGRKETVDGLALPADLSARLYGRRGDIVRLEVGFPRHSLFGS